MMWVSMKYIAVLSCLLAAAFGCVLSSSYDTKPYVSKSYSMFLYDLRSQCPLRISFPSPLLLQMDGESLDKSLGSWQKDDVTAVLFYASWCSFSTEVRSKFGVLSSMFPQIRHVMVEQSKAMPSVFSRYGVHSFPSILIVNQTMTVRYHGSKDLHSLVNFYQKTTGNIGTSSSLTNSSKFWHFSHVEWIFSRLDPVIHVTESEMSNRVDDHRAFQLWNGASLRELLLREPYLVLSVAFLLFRACLYFFPRFVALVVALWVAHVPHLNMGIFGESRQLMARSFHVIDLKRVWNKLNLCKTRNFHKGARSARVWASSLTSVSLGETSSVRGDS